MLFLSTPSARRATGCSTTTTPSQTYFYPRPPRGGRLETVKTTITGCYFYPRPPRGGRPLHPAMMVCSLISIHALREEGDADGCSAECAVLVFLSTPSARRATEALANYRQMNEEDFYPRPPRGGRQLTTASWQKARLFLSTPSARRATTLELSFYLTFQNFYPRPPRGGRLDGVSDGLR